MEHVNRVGQLAGTAERSGLEQPLGARAVIKGADCHHAGEDERHREGGGASEEKAREHRQPRGRPERADVCGAAPGQEPNHYAEPEAVEAAQDPQMRRGIERSIAQDDERSDGKQRDGAHGCGPTPRAANGEADAREQHVGRDLGADAPARSVEDQLVGEAPGMDAEDVGDRQALSGRWPVGEHHQGEHKRHGGQVQRIEAEGSPDQELPRRRSCRWRLSVRVRNNEARQHEEEIHEQPRIGDDRRVLEVPCPRAMKHCDHERADAAQAFECGIEGLAGRVSHTAPEKYHVGWNPAISLVQKETHHVR